MNTDWWQYCNENIKSIIFICEQQMNQDFLILTDHKNVKQNKKLFYKSTDFTAEQKKNFKFGIIY